MRFHRDEQVDPAIAAGLRQGGFDVTTTAGAELLSAPDGSLVALAEKENRVIFTHDQDCLRIHPKGTIHAGVFYCPPQSKSIGQIIRHLCLMHDCLEASEMQGNFEYL
ncbi:DUF5615 family PIN-like protein [Bythopirellula goksoeyrii]|uniref:DUF5615 domain-containing protein n=1 Tax=Bythopirellula goksoeyrii TaxID=1400387 RepID=A0A5B9QAG5_9BACT|nr:DUF5615 family PIN-like protein [Bythopirellula goksoeyrii]QEG36064.1 hypothetical protein Pr1d_33730 [Bythopirellula goksoeyrii]